MSKEDADAAKEQLEAAGCGRLRSPKIGRIFEPKSTIRGVLGRWPRPTCE